MCIDHRDYINSDFCAGGMTFYALRDKRWIVNYPKDHSQNGAAKSQRTGDRYKRTVRMFKNARNHLETHRGMSSQLAPSYFVECLLYNAPDAAFQYRFQDTYCAIVNWVLNAELDRLLCQNECQYLFVSLPEEWSATDARAFANHLMNLWNAWE